MEKYDAIETEYQEKSELEFSKEKENFFSEMQSYIEEHLKEHKWKISSLQESEHKIEAKVNSKGESIELEYRRYEPEVGTEPIIYNVIMTNIENKIIGHSQFYIYKSFPNIMRRIKIYNEFRGQGYSKELTKFGDDLLVKIKEEIEGIQQSIENENFETLIEYLQEIVTGKELYDEKEINKQILEQIRWQNIFLEKYKNHDTLKIKNIKYEPIPDIINLISKAENKENNTLDETAFSKASSIETMLINNFGENLKIATEVIIEPR